MTRTRADARAWLAWAVAGGVLASTTRNPITLAMLLLVVAVVGARLAPPSAIAGSWRLGGRVLIWLAATSVLFNVLLVRAGDVPLVSLPPDWPLGGTITLNALVHGLLTALSLLALLAVWAAFNTVVSQGELLRLIPRPLYLAGLIGSIALTFLPGLTRAAREIGEAQAVRGHRTRGVRDLPPLMVPLLNLGLERGLSLAEAMEARGFGATMSRGVMGAGEQGSREAALTLTLSQRERGTAGHSLSLWERAGVREVRHSPALLATGMILLVGGVLLLLASPWPVIGGAGLAVGLGLTWAGLRHAGPGRTRYRQQRWESSDTVIVAGALLAVAALVVARVSGDGGLDYSVYPTLAPPPVSGWALAAALALLGPVLAAEVGRP
jgi:energy-coupling factor transport system permease protein